MFNFYGSFFKLQVDVQSEFIGNEIEIGRYHSWVVTKDDLPQILEITSLDENGHIMSLRHREFDIRGVQFHPESVLTPKGKGIIKNWISS